MSVQKTTPLLRSERDLCYNFRDLYFSCLEKAGIEDPTKVEEDKVLRKKAETFGCLKKNDQYKRACPSSWVKYFNKKVILEKQRQAILDQINAEKQAT
ncbi:10634_t:CDS:2 [Paraglomus occultum]|uniref:10634_t:CDS:1 n=1 Tax=Paraglomus occultum TaxID=144539 RepID=A0A9N8ZCV9_9GLOM|nr:10634_t:CDS:2 [Paraglomus occultum]